MESTTYEVNLLLGRLCIQLISEVPLSVTDEIRTFCTDTGQADITVYVRVMKQKFRLPKQMVGEDLLLEYYYDNGRFLAAAKRGTKESAAMTVYTPDFSEAVFYINEAEFPGMIRRVSKILQLFPIRQALAGYDAMILHSSRIIAGGNAIIFTAPSQTGKTTQAQLWKQYEDAEIVSNDRTLIQKDKGIFYTMGYPVDGSSPAYCNEEAPLGAVVILKQGPENRIERMRMPRALKLLMEQTVSDVWNYEELTEIQSLWLELMELYPVYQLTCRPDREAVLCLKERLAKDGVIIYGDDD